MVHAKAAVTPSSRRVMEETSPSEQQYTSLVNVNDEDDGVVRQSRTKTHRRHQSLFSNPSAPVDLSDYPSMRRESSLKTDPVLRKTTSGNLNWKLGEFWSKLRAPLKQNAASPSLRSLDAVSETTLSVNQKTVEKQTKTEIDLGVQETGVVRTGEQRQTLELHAIDVKSVSTEVHGIDEAISTGIANTSSSTAAAASPTSKSNSLHFISLNLFSSSKFGDSSKFGSSFGDSNIPSATPHDRSGQLEPSEPPNLSMKWREIQGATNWHGLMDPLDLDLRREILRYGDFAQIAHDNFECNTRSKYAGSARFSKQKLFQKLHKQDCGYEVTRYLYATSENPLPGVLQPSLSSKSWDTDSNWMGYVAVATDMQEIERLGRRDIVVAWRGAGRKIDWLVDAQTQMTPIRVPVENPKVTELQRPRVERGFWSLYTSKRPASQFNRKSASEQVMTELRRLLTLYKGENLSITLTGHNLGGALAILTAYEIAESGLHKQGKGTTIPVTAFTFGSPHVGDGAFRRRFAELQVKLLRVVNVHDVVPKSIVNFYPLWGSSDTNKHLGVELQVNHKLSPYLKSTKDPLDWNDLEVYLHCVDGYQGVKSKSFELVTGRDYALVNKYSDVLEERLCVSAQWRQVENKGMGLSFEGRWMETDRQPEDAPSLANHDRFF
ncbi:hypothetical protein KC19_4G183900 [Ceratodon purpureus]|uniref:Fungal lipase-type domain-containing protein n=1 Tax=Ceratodon purpureus TaxID=3225 RepID=A0A8T0ICF1_CERPU|nr:hypothetical protein KC19_4G183900 [Ceratodon purpureus]